jgi:hypothetical protein
VGKMCVVLALFLLMNTAQKPTPRSLEELAAIHSLYSETLPLERLELILKFIHFSANSWQN